MSKDPSPLSTSTPNTPAPVAEDASRLHLCTTRLARRLRREAGAELTPSQISAMATISSDGPITLGALADCERVTPPTITRVVARLEEDGLVERIPDPEDRRVARVVATGAGDELLAQSRQRKVAWLAERLDLLPARERARIGSALDALERLVDQP